MEVHTVDLTPDTAYNLMHTIVFGLLALSTMRYSLLSDCSDSFFLS
jgi:hypothetical protein